MVPEVQDTDLRCPGRGKARDVIFVASPELNLLTCNTARVEKCSTPEKGSLGGGLGNVKFLMLPPGIISNTGIFEVYLLQWKAGHVSSLHHSGHRPQGVVCHRGLVAATEEGEHGLHS